MVENFSLNINTQKRRHNFTFFISFIEPNWCPQCPGLLSRHNRPEPLPGARVHLRDVVGGLEDKLPTDGQLREPADPQLYGRDSRGRGGAEATDAGGEGGEAGPGGRPASGTPLGYCSGEYPGAEHQWTEPDGRILCQYWESGVSYSWDDGWWHLRREPWTKVPSLQL